ncbi:MAG: SulP family inorganic anion transporter, partial [Bacteroidota bacterium]
MKKNNIKIPEDGFLGIKENFSSDVVSGFLVFLLALPLSLGIAKASEFPAIYGLITAMIGGVIVSFFAGSKLTIKGPAAGLIVIVAGSVTELGQGNSELGWHLALGAVVIAGAFQVLFGALKLGRLSDFFPLSAVHGMLAAIGIIILSKQIHILVGVNPMTHEGKSMVEPLELLALLSETIPNFFLHKEVAIIGIISLIIVFGWPMLKINFLKKVPAPLVVLLVSIPLGMAFGLKNTADFKPLLTFDKGFFDILGVKASFEGVSQTGTFIKFVVMFALVGSLEALLTVKAIDMMDTFKRKSDYNKDLMAVGLGNIIAGLLGGLPMISEVARSSANVNNGAKTRWANF